MFSKAHTNLLSTVSARKPQRRPLNYKSLTPCWQPSYSGQRCLISILAGRLTKWSITHSLKISLFQKDFSFGWMTISKIEPAASRSVTHFRARSASLEASYKVTFSAFRCFVLYEYLQPCEPSTTITNYANDSTSKNVTFTIKVPVSNSPSCWRWNKRYPKLVG